MNTHVFKLPSGVECEVKELIGKHQRILTEQKNKNIAENLNEVLADVLVRVGTVKHITLEFVLNMTASDRKKCLVEARQFSMDHEPVFEFDYEYIDEDGNTKNFPQSVDISDGFPTKPLQVISGDTVMDADYKEYADIVKTHEIVLPRSGSKVRFTLLDGNGELLAQRTSKNKLSSHTALQMLNPQILQESNKGGDPVWIQLNLDNLSLKDIAYLRSSAKEMQGSVDTEIRFENPRADFDNSAEKYITVDLLGVVDFFFPSGTI